MRTATIAVATATLVGAVLANDSTTSAPEAHWGEWSTTSSVKKAEPTKSTTSSSKKADPTTTSAANWAEWESSSSKKTTTTSSSSKKPDPSVEAQWAEWESAKTTTTTTRHSAPATSTATDPWKNWDGETMTVKSTSTQWITVTVYPSGDGAWSVWSAPSSSASKTTNWQTATVTSTVTKTSSRPGMNTASQFGWPVFDPQSMSNQCAMQIMTSYGNPMWKPTPAVATSSKSTSSAEEWGVWSSTSRRSSSTTTSSRSNAATSTTAKSSTTSSTATKSSSTEGWNEWEPKSYKSTTSSKPNAATSKTTSTSAKSSTTTSAAETWEVWSASSSASSTAKTSSAVKTTASATASAAWSQSTSGITVNGNKFGMTYSPYTSSGGCKDSSTVAHDIAAMAAKGFTSVRVYSTDCQTLEYVGAAARASNMKIILGVFISESGINGARPQVDAIVRWAQWDLVELIVVGNEAVFQGRCSPSDLAAFIGESKRAFVAAGYKGAVTTTDELSIWQSSGKNWCDVVDIVAANLYAFFNPNTRAEDAGAFIQAQINDLSKICPGKDVYVMESGWPSAGKCNGVACPSPENQAVAIKGISSAVGAKVVFFSYEDEAWKHPGNFGVEQHWGCGQVF